MNPSLDVQLLLEKGRLESGASEENPGPERLYHKDKACFKATKCALVLVLLKKMILYSLQQTTSMMQRLVTLHNSLVEKFK